MGVPGPAIPLHNSFRVHFFGHEPVFLEAAKALLNPFKVPVQYFASASGMAEEAPPEEFWMTTVAVVQMKNLTEVPSSEQPVAKLKDGMKDRANGKCLLIATASNLGSGDIQRDLIFAPDLWIVQEPDPDVVETTAETWVARGASAVTVFHAGRKACWISDCGAFGKSRGVFAPKPAPAVALEMKPDDLGWLTAGLIQALIEELLGENLFIKTSVSLERECLEMRPLHLARAAESGLAAYQVLTEMFTENPGMTLLHNKGGLLDGIQDEVRRQLAAWRGPEPQAWGNRGR